MAIWFHRRMGSVATFEVRESRPSSVLQARAENETTRQLPSRMRPRVTLEPPWQAKASWRPKVPSKPHNDAFGQAIMLPTVSESGKVRVARCPGRLGPL